MIVYNKKNLISSDIEINRPINNLLLYTFLVDSIFNRENYIIIEFLFILQYLLKIPFGLTFSIGEIGGDSDTTSKYYIEISNSDYLLKILRNFEDRYGKFIFTPNLEIEDEFYKFFKYSSVSLSPFNRELYFDYDHIKVRDLKDNVISKIINFNKDINFINIFDRLGFFTKDLFGLGFSRYSRDLNKIYNNYHNGMENKDTDIFKFISNNFEPDTGIFYLIDR